MTYPGGKAGAGVYQAIINQIPPHRLYVEPFLGDGAVLRHKRPAARSVGVEIDRDVAAAFSCGLAGVEIYNCCGVEWLRHAFNLYRVQPPPPKPAARPGATHRRRRPHNPAAAAGNDNPAGAPGAAAFVYADPPYPREVCRDNGRHYRHELTTAQHVELLDVLKRLPCLVAVSCYWCKLYAEALAGWRLVRFTGHTRGGPAVECLWLNYPPPAELHDSRYLGRDKRERERIRRRCRNWAAGLDRLDPLERQAVLDAIAARGGPLDRRTNGRPGAT